MIENAQVQIRDLVTKMHLAAPAENALIKNTSKLYEELIANKVSLGLARSTHAATALFLACDGHACVALPKVKYVCGSSVSMKHISKAREILQLPHGTAHEKLNTLCSVCNISNRDFIKKAHHFVSLLDEEGSFMPTTMAAAAFWSAGVALDYKERLSQNKISKLTGCTELTIRKASDILSQRVTARREVKEGNEIDNGRETM